MIVSSWFCSSGRYSHSTARGHRCGGGASRLRHHQEAPASLGRHGRHHLNALHVSPVLLSDGAFSERQSDSFRFTFLPGSSSFTCGLAGALASNPVDVVRTRMMNQRVLSGGPLYKGTLDGVMQTWRNEGFFALYKGFWPNWLRLGPWNIIVSFKSSDGGAGFTTTSW